MLLAVHEALSHGVTVSAAIHVERGWNPTADRHLDHQLVRRGGKERLKPWGADPDELSDPLLARQLQFADTSTDNLGLPMSGLILRWEDVQPESGRRAEAVQAVCRRCRAAQGARRDERGWTRTNPRP